MGIDVYARWRNQTKAEADAQITGFSITHGHAGYLREAYHGGPYVTKFLLREAFQSDGRAVAIPAAILRQRLPAAVLLALYRDQKVYATAGNSPFEFDLGQDDIAKQLTQALARVFAVEIPDTSHEEIVRHFDEARQALARQLIEQRRLPNHAQSFVDFVELCERREREIGEPCRIEASF
jgi:hypothetical protein